MTDWDYRYAWAASEREAEQAEATIQEQAAERSDSSIKPCGCYADDPDCPAEHRAYNEKQGWRAP